MLLVVEHPPCLNPILMYAALQGTIFEHAFGFGGPRMRRGQSIRTAMTISFQEAVKGTSKVRCTHAECAGYAACGCGRGVSRQAATCFAGRHWRGSVADAKTPV